ncbi:MAG: hypothetical protein LBQ89_06160 [Treponema sp.]|jgi:hypothetical protein|nr:hypothetical protein [Treponema sp.]
MKKLIGTAILIIAAMTVYAEGGGGLRGGAGGKGEGQYNRDGYAKEGFHW